MVLWLIVVSLFFGILFRFLFFHHQKGFVKSFKHVMCIESNHGTDLSAVRALFVTAHPDDECMFFAPTIIQLVQFNASVNLLCLSEGNYYNQGSLRKEELLNSCAVLGIQGSKVSIIDDKNFPDDPNAQWSISLVSSVVSKHIKMNSINLVLTFDGRGVSGHANHTAIYKAVSHLAYTGHLPIDCCLLSLETVGVIRKYLSLLELPLSWLLPSSVCCMIGLEGYRQAKAAMLCHRTQLLWFRYLYVMFSRYMFVNTFHIIPQGPKNLKMY
ncbi:N-acetylglucosaminyl-phosphatidylinositol de-N-acetylase [Periophthalmus magnuspinnatus]|uniref:N-acetylglucosaminyl-phosphatidylinositol de-N-acetylase n=1 Tax=Periophthalmus magnuspinnatus TaxID=409849 RepID=UPI00145B9BAC|nr:N-acetylglucosaminyl-phosphatidylinositol de-N-acetylase [Periophthalmus magnuspinnatus]